MIFHSLLVLFLVIRSLFPDLVVADPGMVAEAPSIAGIVANPLDPSSFDLIIKKGSIILSPDDKQTEYIRQFKYFLSALTIPDQDQWVNLSPYEHDRIIPENFGRTVMGSDLLEQDRILKLTVSDMMHPDSPTGRAFWKRVYEQAWTRFGTTDIPLDVFNKVWITPGRAVVIERNGGALIVESSLKVMTGEDYQALKRMDVLPEPQTAQTNIVPALLAEIIIPELEHEINTSPAFTTIRQICRAMIIATWYKESFSRSLLGQAYADRSALQGIDQELSNIEKIYRDYLSAFNLGAFDIIREHPDPQSGENIPRRYYSGGFSRAAGSAGITAVAPGSHLQQIAAEGFERLSFRAESFSDIDRSQLSETEKAERILFLQKKREELNSPERPYQIMASDVHAHPPVMDNIIALVDKLQKLPPKKRRPIEVIFKGDFFDRGKQNLAVYEKMKLLKAREQDGLKIVYIYGNHEVGLLKAFILGEVEAWKESYGSRAYREFTRNAPDERDLFAEVAEFIVQHFQPYYLDSFGVLHVHAGIHPDLIPGDLREIDEAVELFRSRLLNVRNLRRPPVRQAFETLVGKEKFIQLIQIRQADWLEHLQPFVDEGYNDPSGTPASGLLDMVLARNNAVALSVGHNHRQIITPRLLVMDYSDFPDEDPVRNAVFMRNDQGLVLFTEVVNEGELVISQERYLQAIDRELARLAAPSSFLSADSPATKGGVDLSRGTWTLEVIRNIPPAPEQSALRDSSVFVPQNIRFSILGISPFSLSDLAYH